MENVQKIRKLIPHKQKHERKIVACNKCNKITKGKSCLCCKDWNAFSASEGG
jgi:recombinational DNA repair protein RecR